MVPPESAMLEQSQASGFDEAHSAPYSYPFEMDREASS